MLTDKEIKKKYKKVFSESPETFYPVQYIQDELGFTRNKCEKCGRYFWNLDKERKVCGDNACTGKFDFFDIKKNHLTYFEIWKTFSNHLKKTGKYTPIKRYPVVARWRSDLHFVEASIDDFIPYVINGAVEAPANPLTVPQFCLRFNDIGNVGITGSHYTGFVMIGQHRFEKPENYNPNLYMKQLSSYFFDVLGLNKKEITYHEDVWAGTGNFGPSMEMFSGGLELCNQVYMQYHYTGGEPEYEDLKLKVLDMGLGQERVAWFASKQPISYESTYEMVVEKLKKKTGIKTDEKLIKKFYPLAGKLNLDETENIDDAWKIVAGEIGIQVDELKNKILPLQAIYSIADHTRSLLFAISDGGLPSNSGGGYNLRVIFRRAYDFIKKYNWDIEMGDVAEWHAEELKEQYPELKNNIEEVKLILKVEADKYEDTREKIKKTIEGMKGTVNEERMIELYDSHGITPELLKQSGIKVEIGDDFYSKIAERHRRKEETIDENVFDLKDVPKTAKLYHKNYKQTKFTAKILKIIDKKHLILDKTIFYPTSGGQDHDTGEIEEYRVENVDVQDGIIIHTLEKDCKLKEGQKVTGEINKERRIQLTQHHTAVHVVNGSARKVLGNHIWQAGASKTVEKARLDITHFGLLSEKELNDIEDLANRVIQKGIEVESNVLSKKDAEKKYGFILYQGGAIPGNELRIVKIGNHDVEACGGTHLNNTKELEAVKIVSATKQKDGVIRLEIKAGHALEKYFEEITEEANRLCRMLGCNYKQLPEKVKELFIAWKVARKGREAEFKLGKYEEAKPETLKEKEDVQKHFYKACEEVRVQPEYAHRTIERFLGDLKGKEE